MSEPTPYITIISACIMQDGKVLIGKRASSMRYYPTRFEFPGGKVEDEDDRSHFSTSYQAYMVPCLVREMREELGLELTPTSIGGVLLSNNDILFNNPQQHPLPLRFSSHLLHVHLPNGITPVLNKEVHDSIEWYSREELQDLLLDRNAPVSHLFRIYAARVVVDDDLWVTTASSAQNLASS